ncbi:uncharacterized protein EI97DRAFT_430347 [Westerdykella ornata]|uniref:Rhodopsin domain-containing protein n=1 Tax=Westerdykella ornata TaxID=318751 RepID=A0A6A6JRJ7_WESOR|nr:uncharacterized protein EI97DRAFT_430347 [Westerdykella ornata]KAF2279250.1 hypothetical protein EI97DRAFT_430347 [Westerdykella ornata]
MAFQAGRMPAWKEITIHTTEQRSLLAVPFVFTVLAGVTTGLRLYSRRLQKTTLSASDWFCLVAMLFAIVTLVMNWIMVFHGSGLWLKDVGREQFLLWIKLQVATYLIWMCSVTALQISILAFYTKTFGIYRTFRAICFGMIGIVSAWFIGAFCSYLFACNPVHKLWDTMTPGKCTLGIPLCASVGMIHIVLDASILIMPIPLAWRLQMATSSKIVLTVLLLLGLFATVCAVIRLECLVKILPGALANPTYSLWQALLFQFTEVPVGIICICVPTLRPVSRAFSESKVGGYFSSIFSTSSHSKISETSEPKLSSTYQQGSIRSDREGLKVPSAHATSVNNASSYDDLPDFPEIQTGNGEFSHYR